MRPTTYHRFRKKDQVEPRNRTSKLITFKVGTVHYAIAIAKVQYILKEFTIQAQFSGGPSLIRHHDTLITLVDLAQLFLDHDHSEPQNYLMVCLTAGHDSIGLPVAEIPVLLEVSEDHFESLSNTHQQTIGLKGIDKIIKTSDGKTLFHLNIDLLHH